MASKKNRRKKAGLRKSSKANKEKARTASRAKLSKPVAREEKPRAAGRRLRARPMPPGLACKPAGLRAAAGGQSGDIQGISATPKADSESVRELQEEGQSYEAEAVDAVENALDPDQGEVRTREVEENDVPEEYQHLEP